MRLTGTTALCPALSWAVALAPACAHPGPPDALVLAVPAVVRYQDPDRGISLELRNEAHTPRLDFYRSPRDGGNVKITSNDSLWALIQALAALDFFEKERRPVSGLPQGNVSITVSGAGRVWERRPGDTNPSPFPVFLEVLRAAYDGTPQDQAMSRAASVDLLRRAARGAVQ